MSYRLDAIADLAERLGDFEKTCAITVALKISDDSCKMDEYERSVFMAVYDALPRASTDFFGEDVFRVIRRAREEPSAQAYAAVKLLRESAMEIISRPKMKAFKASIRVRISS